MSTEHHNRAGPAPQSKRPSQSSLPNNDPTRRLSVIVPIYNSEPHLVQALESISAATDYNDEILLVNDGSTDGSADIAAEFAKKHPERIRIIGQKNRGYGAACNAGLREAQGKYIAIFEPDDWVDPDFYKALLLTAESLDVDMACANGFIAFQDGEASGLSEGSHFAEFTGRKLERDFHRPFWMKRHPCIWNAVYRRQALADAECLFTEGAGASYQDTQFCISLFYAIQSLAIIPAPGYHYRKHAQQSLRFADSKTDAVIRNWRESLDWFLKTQHGDGQFFMSRTFLQFANLCYYRVEAPAHRRALFEAIRDLAKETGVRRLSFPGTRLGDRLLYPLLCRSGRASLFFMALFECYTYFTRFYSHLPPLFPKAASKERKS